MATGNHEFSRYVGEAFEDERYRLGTYDYVQRHFRNDLTFAAREICGVNFVACNNGYYRFTGEQLDAVRKEQAGCKYRFYVELYHTDSLS
jgi:hypothetical protein